MGAHHTLEMELHRAFSIEKDDWDMISLDRIDTACDQTKKADAAAVVLEPGLAHVCLYVCLYQILLLHKRNAKNPFVRVLPDLLSFGLFRRVRC